MADKDHIADKPVIASEAKQSPVKEDCGCNHFEQGGKIPAVENKAEGGSCGCEHAEGGKPESGKVYYNSHGYSQSWKDFIDTEVHERNNQSLKTVKAWEKKYSIKPDSKVIWVTENPMMALTYLADPESRDDVDAGMSLEDFEEKWGVSKDDLHEVKASDGFIIPESDDGDNGFVFVYNNVKAEGGKLLRSGGKLKDAFLQEHEADKQKLQEALNERYALTEQADSHNKEIFERLEAIDSEFRKADLDAHLNKPDFQCTDSMPDELVQIIKEQGITNKSPYSCSMYNCKKTWSSTEPGCLTVTDHFNFYSQGEYHKLTTQPLAQFIHKKFGVPVEDVVTSHYWYLAKYDSTATPFMQAENRAEKGAWVILDAWLPDNAKHEAKRNVLWEQRQLLEKIKADREELIKSIATVVSDENLKALFSKVDRNERLINAGYTSFDKYKKDATKRLKQLWQETAYTLARKFADGTIRAKLTKKEWGGKPGRFKLLGETTYEGNILALTASTVTIKTPEGKTYTGKNFSFIPADAFTEIENEVRYGYNLRDDLFPEISYGKKFTFNIDDFDFATRDLTTEEVPELEIKETMQELQNENAPTEAGANPSLNANHNSEDANVEHLSESVKEYASGGTIKDKVLAAADALKAMKTHGELRQWAISNGMDNRSAFPKFKLALNEIGLDYDQIKTGIIRQREETLQAAITHEVTLYVDAKASAGKFGITDADGEVLWYGRFFDNEDAGEQSRAELEAAKKAVWLAMKVKEAIGAEAIRLNLFVDAQWLTYQDHAGQKGYVLSQLARKYNVDLHVEWIPGAQNPADKWTTASGYKKWSDNNLEELAEILEAQNSPVIANEVKQSTDTSEPEQEIEEKELSFSENQPVSSDENAAGEPNTRSKPQTGNSITDQTQANARQILASLDKSKIFLVRQTRKDKQGARYRALEGLYEAQNAPLRNSEEYELITKPSTVTDSLYEKGLYIGTLQGLGTVFIFDVDRPTTEEMVNVRHDQIDFKPLFIETMQEQAGEVKPETPAAPKEETPWWQERINLRNNTFPGGHPNVDVSYRKDDGNFEVLKSIENTKSENKQDEYVRLQLEKRHYNAVVDAVKAGKPVPQTVIDYYASGDSLVTSRYGNASINNALHERKSGEEQKYRVFTVHKSDAPVFERDNLSRAEAETLFYEQTKLPDSEIVTWDYIKGTSRPTVKLWTAKDKPVSVSAPVQAVMPKPETPLPPPDASEIIKQHLVEKSGIPKENLIVTGIGLEPKANQLTDPASTFQTTDTDKLNDYFKQNPGAHLLIDGGDFAEYKIRLQEYLYWLQIRRKPHRSFHQESLETQHIKPMIETVLSLIKQHDRSGSKPIRKAILYDKDDNEVAIYTNIKVIETPFPDDDDSPETAQDAPQISPEQTPVITNQPELPLQNEPAMSQINEATEQEVAQAEDTAPAPSAWFFDDNYYKANPDHVLGTPYQTSGLHGEVTKYKGDISAVNLIQAPLDFLEAFPDNDPLVSVEPPTAKTEINTPEGKNNAEAAITKSRKSVRQKKAHKETETLPGVSLPPMQDKLFIHQQYNTAITNEELFSFIWYYDSIERRLSQHWYDLSFQLGATIEYLYDDLTLHKWVREGNLFYYGGFDEKVGGKKLLHSVYYLAGNIKNRHAQLEQDKERIIELYGQEVYEAQKVAIDKSFSERKHNWLRIGGTEEKMPLILLPNSEFAQKFMISSLVDEDPFHFKRVLSESSPRYGHPDFYSPEFKPGSYLSYGKKKYYHNFPELSLSDAFCAWMLTDTSIVFKKGANALDVIKYYVHNANMVYTGDKNDDRAKKQFEDYKMRMKQRTKEEGDRLFQEFLSKQLHLNDILRIEYQWNGEHNSNVPVDYNKIPIVFECAREYAGENPLQIKPEKREAATFIFAEGAGCLAYGTGVGKTMSSIFTIAQFMYAGWAKRPLIVVPNQVYKQFISEIRGILPQFNVLGLYNLGEDYLDLVRDAEGAIAKIPANTISVVTYEGFRRIGFNEQTRNELLWQMYDILDQSEEAEKTSESKRTKFMEDLEALVGAGERGGMVNIEDLGLDFFVMDEAHKMKKVFVSVKGRAMPGQKGEKDDGGVKRQRSGIDIKGGSKPSAIALKGFMLCQYIQRNNHNGNVVLLTATPFTNSALEIYSMLSMVAYEKMKSYDVNNIVDFFDEYISTKYDLVINSRNKPEKRQIVDGFRNAYALNRMVTRFINRKSEDDVKSKKPRKVVLPLLQRNVNGVLINLDEQERIETFLPMTREQEMLMQEIINYAEGKTSIKELGSASFQNARNNPNEFDDADSESDEGSVDTTEGAELDEEMMDKSERDKARYIRAINYSQMLAISPYLYANYGKKNPTPKQFIDSSPKLKYITDCIQSVKKWHDRQTDPVKKQISGQIIYSDRGLEYFTLIRDYLIEVVGFKAHEVEIITGKNHKRGSHSKSAIQDRFLGQQYNDATMMFEEIPDSERVKVIIGSSVIKEGMNLQKFSSTLYNCYIEWNPTDVIQLEGRIWRQGNQFGAVRIVIPMLIDSIDIFLFQKLQEKTARINSIWTVDGKTSQIKLEEFNAEELKFGLIRDAKVLAKLRIEGEEALLQEESSVLKQETEKVENIKEYIKDLERNIKNAETWLEEYRNVKPGENEPIWERAKYLATTMNNVLRTPTDKEGRKIYQGTWSEEYKKDKKASPLSDGSYPHEPYWFDDFNKAQRSMVRAYDGFMRPKNLTLEMLDDYVVKAQQEVERLEEEIKNLGSNENIDRLAQQIEADRQERNIQPKSLKQVVDDFIKLNDECLGSRSAFVKIKEAKPVFTTCPPTDANGERLITPEAVKWLEECIANDPDTKLLHSKPLKSGGVEYNEYRKALHQEIIKEVMRRAQCVKGKNAPIAILTGGAPASGKSTWLNTRVPYLKDYVLHIDADEIRGALPEYKGWNAFSTAHETKDIVVELLDKIGTPCKYDILYDGTMGNAEKYFRLVEKLKKLGYKVFVVFMDVPEDVVQQRALERYRKHGRYVSHTVISSFFRDDDAGKPTLKKLRSKVDGFVVVDGITGKVIDKGGMEIPLDRPYLKAMTEGLQDLNEKMLKAISAIEKMKEEGAVV